MHDKIKVLFLASDPFRTGAALRLDEEVRAIGNAIRRGRARDSVELVSHFATRTRDLREALLQHEPQIVHFAGHGDAPGVIYLGDEYGRPQRVDREALRKLFGILNDTVRVVVLNGCDTLATVEALSEVVDYTVGMNRPISDDSAIVFAEAFYSALAMGRNVLAAFELAVCQLELEGNPEADIPVRRIRRGANLDLPLVSPPKVPEAAVEPRAAGGARENELGESDGEDVVFDNRLPPGPDADGGSGTQISHFSQKGRGFTFRNFG